MRRQRRRAGRPAHLQGRLHPARHQAQQGRLAHAAVAHRHPLGRRAPDARRAAPARAALLPRQLQRLHHLLPLEPRPPRLRAGRLSGAHAHRRDGPAHPPRQVRRHLVRRLRQRLELRGRHLQPAGGAGAHPRHQRRRRLQEGQRHHRQARTAPAPDARPRGPRRRRQRHRRLARRADHRPALVGRPDPQPPEQRPHAAHRLHPRPLRPLDAPADRPLRGPRRRARRLEVARPRERHVLRRRGRRLPLRRRPDELARRHHHQPRVRELPRVPAGVRRLPARLQGRHRARLARPARPRPGGRHQPAGQGRGRPAQAGREDGGLPGQQLRAAVPRGHLGRRRRHDERQLPQRADPLAPDRRLRRPRRGRRRRPRARLPLQRDARQRGLQHAARLLPAAHERHPARRPVHADAARLRERPRPDPHPRRRARGGAQLRRPRHQVALRAV